MLHKVVNIVVDIVGWVAVAAAIFAIVWWITVGRHAGPKPLFTATARLAGAAKCPWCNSDSLDIQVWENDVTAVACNFCDCEGPTAATEEQAIMLWNTRVRS